MTPYEAQLGIFHDRCAEWEPDGGPPKDPATCLHENAEHHKYFDDSSGEFTEAPCPESVEFLGCLDCRSLLALELGPASDTPDVMIEIRAAEIAAGGHAFQYGRLRSMHWFEGCGWNAGDPEPDADQLSHSACDNGEPEDGPMHQAGYLAAIIVHHDTGH